MRHPTDHHHKYTDARAHAAGPPMQTQMVMPPTGMQNQTKNFLQTEMQMKVQLQTKIFLHCELN